MCGYSRLALLVLIQHRLCLPSSHYVFAALPTHLLVFFAFRLLATSSKQAKPRGPANEQTSKHRPHAPKRGQSSPESSPVRSTLVCSLAYTPHIWHWHMWDYKMSLISTILQKLKLIIQLFADQVQVQVLVQVLVLVLVPVQVLSLRRLSR